MSHKEIKKTMENQPEEPFFRLTPTGGGGCGKLGDHSSQSVIKINLGKQICQPMINGTIKVLALCTWTMVETICSNQ